MAFLAGDAKTVLEMAEHVDKVHRATCADVDRHSDMATLEAGAQRFVLNRLN